MPNIMGNSTIIVSVNPCQRVNSVHHSQHVHDQMNEIC